MEFKDTAFPIVEDYMKLFAEKTQGSAVIVCEPSWFAHLMTLSSKYYFSVIEWDERKKEEILARIPDFEVVVIATPEGEDKLASIISERVQKVNTSTVILRLLRDVFLQISLQLDGPFMPQEKWKRCRPDHPSYFIFAIPRSGSTFFGDILIKTNLLGFPREHLTIEQMEVFTSTDLTFNEWVRALISYSFTQNGYSGSKIISHLFLLIREKYRERPDLYNDLLIFLKEYPIIYLKRRNKVRQAVSLLKATNTAVWHIKNNEKIMDSGPREITSESPEKIEDTMTWLIEQQQKLDELFLEAGIEPRIYFYEDFSDEIGQQEFFRGVIKSLGIKYRKDIPKASYTTLSDDYNEAVVRNYFAFIEQQMKGFFNRPEPLKSAIMDSLALEITRNHKKHSLEEHHTRPKRKRFWKF
jgi:LPS sulfotransferase NodH